MDIPVKAPVLWLVEARSSRHHARYIAALEKFKRRMFAEHFEQPRKVTSLRPGVSTRLGVVATPE
jgi:hypothetical protein